MPARPLQFPVESFLLHVGLAGRYHQGGQVLMEWSDIGFPFLFGCSLA